MYCEVVAVRLMQIELGGAYADLSNDKEKDSLKSEMSYVERTLGFRTKDLENRDFRLVTDIVGGTFRWKRYLDYLILSLCRDERTFTTMGPLLLQILVIGCYELVKLEMPPHAVVNENVNLAKIALRPGAGNMVNGILQKLVSLKESNTIPVPSLDGDDRAQARALSTIHSHPVVLDILEELPDGTKKKLAKKGFFPQEGYILRYLPVPPNYLSIPDISDGDVASTMLKNVLRQIETIKSTRSDEHNFESNQVEINELQLAVSQYLQVRGAGTVEECNLDLSFAKDYHHKHRVCEIHSKSPKVVICGVERRFCQQCSRFHSLSEFDQRKRRCRRTLSDHNARRRKPKPEIIQFNSMRLSSLLHGLILKRGELRGKG